MRRRERDAPRHVRASCRRVRTTCYGSSMLTLATALGVWSHHCQHGPTARNLQLLSIFIASSFLQGAPSQSLWTMFLPIHSSSLPRLCRFLPLPHTFGSPAPTCSNAWSKPVDMRIRYQVCRTGGAAVRLLKPTVA